MAQRPKRTAVLDVNHSNIDWNDSGDEDLDAVLSEESEEELSGDELESSESGDDTDSDCCGIDQPAAGECQTCKLPNLFHWSDQFSFNPK